MMGTLLCVLGMGTHADSRGLKADRGWAAAPSATWEGVGSRQEEIATFRRGCWPG